MDLVALHDALWGGRLLAMGIAGVDECEDLWCGVAGWEQRDGAVRSKTSICCKDSRGGVLCCKDIRDPALGLVIWTVAQ